MKVTNSQRLAAPTKHLKPHQVLTKKSQSVIGAPAQHNQSSRKGKRAWRKNVDIGEVEDALEGMRAEERVTGLVLFLALRGVRLTRVVKDDITENEGRRTVPGRSERRRQEWVTPSLDLCR
jgi:hypothetical protein